MNRRLKFIEINYHCHREYRHPEQVIEKHRAASGFAPFLQKEMDTVLVKHLDFEGQQVVNGVIYRFFKSHNKPWYIPFQTHRFVKKEQPDIVIVQGFVFLLQVLVLRMQLGKRCKILLQHHGEQPYRRIRGFIQRLMGRVVHGFIFTSYGHADEWIKAGVIRDRHPCFELLSASTWFRRLDKRSSKAATGMDNNLHFLWVGRLNQNKDPLAVLEGFEKYVAVKRDATLHLIYQTGEMLGAVRQKIENSNLLREKTILHGNISHEKLEQWYSAADFFISGSHREALSYALLEAMACGCIPVVTRIPSALKITEDGKYGLLFRPGDTGDLAGTLLKIDLSGLGDRSAAIENHFKEMLSFSAIARQLNGICRQLVAE